MIRRIRPLLPILMVPVLMAAAAVEPTGMFKKIISNHGTYLESAQPMECGDCLDGEASRERVRTWFERVAWWPNFRHMYPLGQWETDVQSCRAPRSAQECLAALQASGVPHEVLDDVDGLFVPVKITGPVEGVKFVQSKDLIVECELAAALPYVARVLSDNEITEVGVLSSYREDSLYSFHSLGLALDVNWMRSSRFLRAMWLKVDYEATPQELTCKAKTTTPMGKVLQKVACDLWDARVFNTVITPNYNEAHDNHFHFDLRPGDNRYFLR